MRPMAALITLVAALLANPAVAAAAPPRPTDLFVPGGVWHADNSFTLTWAKPPIGGPPLAATHVRIRDPQGIAIGESQLSGSSDGVGGLTVPKVPGAYSAEVWFESISGEMGPAASTELRFDDDRPEAVAPGWVPEWIGRTTFPLRVRLGHPSGPQPLSGIRGYAAEIDADPGGVPCSAPSRCSETETTLRGGIDEDELSIDILPEGTSYLHVVAVSGAGMKSATSGRAVLRVDTTYPVTYLSGAPGGWTDRTVELTADASDDRSGMATEDEARPPFTAIRIDDGAPEIAPGPSVKTSVIAEGAHRIAYYARDAAGNIDDGAAANGVPDHAPRTVWVRIDRTPPRVAFANSQDASDPDLIRVRIVDSLSGPDLSRGWIGVRRTGSGDQFTMLPRAAPGSGELRARWNSDTHPIGEYEFKAIAYDAAGNLAIATRRMNGAAMILANPLKATTTLRDAFRPRGVSRTVPYGRGVRLDGHLFTGLSSPLSGAPVRIVERFAAGSRPSMRVSTVRTGPTGAFSIRTAPGPSRTVELVFDGGSTLARSVGPVLQLDVRSRIQLRASANSAQVGGEPLTFSGRVVAPAGTIPADGMPVQLQFRAGHSPWSEFHTAQTDRRGRFRYAYRFSDDDSRGVRFQFRAYVQAQDNWPFEPAGSRPVIVRGI